MESCELRLSLDEPTNVGGCSMGARRTWAESREDRPGPDRRGSAMADLLKLPAFRQYSDEIKDVTSMSRQNLVKTLRRNMINTGNHDISAYIDSRQRLGLSNRRYFSHNRDVILTSSGENSPDNYVIKHPPRRHFLWNSCWAFRMPTFGEFLAESVAEHRRNRSTLETDDVVSNLKDSEAQGKEQHNEVVGRHLVSSISSSRPSKFCVDNTETINSAMSSAIMHNDTEDNDYRGHVIHRASPPPSHVASIDTGLQQIQQEYITCNRRDSGEYDPSIWDFLSHAPVDNDEDDSDDDDDVDDDAPDGGGGGDETKITLRSPREVDIRSIKHAQAVQEIVETEISYSNDLAIIKREFYDTLKGNYLLNEEQLQATFLNLAELISVSNYFTKRLCATTGLDRHNEPPVYKRLTDSRIGRAFLDSTHMLLAFETYCVNQSTAALLIDQLTQERDVLRVFLDQLQKERPALRKMDLKAFLMLPVQRVTKYPLLLDRLLKLTPDDHADRNDILLARRYVEETLSVINAKAIGSLKMKRRRAAALWPKKNLALENIEVTQVALDLLRWNRSETHFLLVGRVFYSPLNNFRSVREAVHCVVATLGIMDVNCKDSGVGANIRRDTLKHVHSEVKSHRTIVSPIHEDSSSVEPRHLLFPRQSSMRSAAVVIFKKDRSGKYLPVQEPVMLERSIVSIEAGSAHILELHEMNRDSCFIKTENPAEMETWLQQLKMLTMSLGAWRRRRYALANVMTHRYELELNQSVTSYASS